VIKTEKVGLIISHSFLSVVGPGSGNVSSFDIWGSNLSLITSIDTMKIDIVVSEFGKASDKKKSKTVPPSVAGNKGCRNCGNLNASFQNLAVYSRVLKSVPAGVLLVFIQLC